MLSSSSRVGDGARRRGRCRSCSATRCTPRSSLVLTLFGVAVHFVALEAHFLAAVQVIVYAGAIVVLFLFVIMLLGVDQAEDLRDRAVPDPAPAGRRRRRRHRRPASAPSIGPRRRARRGTGLDVAARDASTATPTSGSSPRNLFSDTCSRSSSRRCCWSSPSSARAARRAVRSRATADGEATTT